jgi:hypothetical protein
MTSDLQAIEKPGSAGTHEVIEEVEDDPYDREVIERLKALGVCQGCGTDILAEGGANEDCDHAGGCGVMHGRAQRPHRRRRQRPARLPAV